MEEWQKPLLVKEEEYSGFEMKVLSLSDNITIKDELLTPYNNNIVYLKQESKENVEAVSVENASFILVVNNDIFDNELIIVYSDNECTNEIGRFVAHYKQNEYNLSGNQILGSSSNIALFNSNLFVEEEENNVNVEMANITKQEYEILKAKINQLMKLLNKK